MRAPKKDRIYGSKRNKPGSAATSKSSSVKFSKRVEDSLKKKVKEHNEKAPDGRRATLGMLKAAYRRGAGAFSSSHRPGMGRDQWAMARVNAYLKLLKSGKPKNKNYKQDNDLLPAGHPKSSKGKTASGGLFEDLEAQESLVVDLREPDQYESTEELLFNLSELSGLGYEMITPLRAAWVRAVRDNESPFDRAYELATKTYESRDSDLLPRKVNDSE